VTHLLRQRIRKTQEFFKSLNLPLRLSEVDIKETDLELMSHKAIDCWSGGALKRLDRNDALNILKMAF
jgi:alcohol dehydrogenase